MIKRTRSRIAAWAALLAMALHAVSPFAAPAPRAGSPGLHDLCTSAPSAPQPAGDPSTSHCALCVQPASIAGPTFAFQAPAAAIAEVAARVLTEPPSRQPYPSAPTRAPPSGA